MAHDHCRVFMQCEGGKFISRITTLYTAGKVNEGKPKQETQPKQSSRMPEN